MWANLAAATTDTAANLAAVTTDTAAEFRAAANTDTAAEFLAAVNTDTATELPAVQETEAPITGAAENTEKHATMWQAMDFEVIQDLRRRRDLAALAADEEAALAAEEGAALAADEEAEHSTDAAFSEGDGSSDDESGAESQDDEFITVRTVIRNCIIGNQLFNFTNYRLSDEEYARVFEDSIVSDAQDSQIRFVQCSGSSYFEVTKEQYEIWWDVQLEHELCGWTRYQRDTWQKVEDCFDCVRGRGDVDVQEH